MRPLALAGLRVSGACDRIRQPTIANHSRPPPEFRTPADRPQPIRLLARGTHCEAGKLQRYGSGVTPSRVAVWKPLWGWMLLEFVFPPGA